MRRKELVSLAKVLLLLVVAVVLQVLLVSRISVLGVTADLFLILTAIIGLSKGSLEGALFGFFAGVVHDMAYYQPLGVHALIYILVGYFVGMFLTRFQTVNLWAILILTGISSFAAQFVFGLFQYVTGPRGAFFTMIGTQIIPEAILDALIAVPIFILLVRMHVLPAFAREQTQARSATE